MISRLKVEPSCCCNITSQRKKKARNALCKLARIDKDTRPLRAALPAAAVAAAAMRSTGCHASEFANSRPTWIKLTYDEVILSHCHGSGFIRHPLSRMMPKSGPPVCLWWCPRPPWWHLILPKKVVWRGGDAFAAAAAAAAAASEVVAVANDDVLHTIPLTIFNWLSWASATAAPPFYFSLSIEVPTSATVTAAAAASARRIMWGRSAAGGRWRWLDVHSRSTATAHKRS